MKNIQERRLYITFRIMVFSKIARGTITIETNDCFFKKFFEDQVLNEIDYDRLNPQWTYLCRRC